jgi:hypothetical protein
VDVTLKPAPQGVGLAVGDVAKSILRLAGITDAWGFTKGHTKTTVNYAIGTFDALRKNALLKVRPEQAERLKIRSGAEKVFVRTPEAAPEVPAEAGAQLPEPVPIEGAKLPTDVKEPAKDVGATEGRT